ncbi:hypothetical protein II582_02925 [bacterium]|nr:hypothetical protein [bacterium]
MGLSEWDTSSVTIMNIMFSSVQIS